MNVRQVPIYFHRLRAMSGREMVYRVSRNVSARLSQYHLLRKWLTGPGERKGSGFSGAGGRAPAGAAFFTWQKMSAAQVGSYCDSRWPEYRVELCQAAERLRAHEFKIFDRAVTFPRKIDWHYDAVSGTSLPRRHWTRLHYWKPGVAPGVKYIWELNRHQHFVTLAQAFLISGNEAYGDELAAQWLDWLDANPPQTGINWSSALEMGLRLVSWTWALVIARQARAWNADIDERVLESFRAQACHIDRHLSLYSSANNHLLGELLGLIYAGSCFPEFPEAASWRDKGFTGLFRELLRQIHPDGVIQEQSSGYLRYLFEITLLAKGAAEQWGVAPPEAVLQRLEKMAEFVAAILDERGQIAPIGDGDDGQAILLDPRCEKPYADLLGYAALLFNRSDFKQQSAGWSPALFWIFGADGEEKFNRMAAFVPQRVLQIFPQGGYAIVRSEACGVQQLALFDAGPLGLDAMAAHGHADALNFLLTVAGQPVLIDSGTYTYRGPRQWRNYFRGTSAHNTVVIDGRDQSEILGPFQWGRHARAVLHTAEADGSQVVLAGSHTGYRPIVHQRRILHNGRERWEINDALMGEGAHRIQLFWHFAPCELQQTGAEAFYARFAFFQVDLRIRASRPCDFEIVTGRKKPIQGWFSPHFAVKKANPVLCINIQDVVPVQITTEFSLQFFKHKEDEND